MSPMFEDDPARLRAEQPPAAHVLPLDYPAADISAAHSALPRDFFGGGVSRRVVAPPRPVGFIAHSIRYCGIFGLLAWTALVGCRQLGPVRMDASESRFTTLTEPALFVPMVGAGKLGAEKPGSETLGSSSLLLTRRTEVILSSRGRIYVQEPDSLGWRSARIGADGIPFVSTEREGRYRFCAVRPDPSAVVGDLEATVQFWVDRTPPFLALQLDPIEAAGSVPSRLRVTWSALDDRPLREDPTILFSENRGESWIEVSGVSGSGGEFEWPMSGEDLDAWRFRLVAADRAGNLASLERDGLGHESGSSRSPSVSSDPPVITMGDPTVADSNPADSPSGSDEPTEVVGERSGVAPEENIVFEVVEILPTAGGLSLGWKLEDRAGGSAVPGVNLKVHWLKVGALSVGSVATDSAPVELDTQYRSALLRGRGRDRVTLPPGDYRVFLSAETPSGTRVYSPAPANARRVRITRATPKVLGLRGARLRGGSSRRLAFDRLDPGLVDGLIGVYAVAVDPARSEAEGQPLEFLITEVEATTTSRIWRIPRVNGEYSVEYRWTDGAGEPRVASDDQRIRFDSMPPRIRWDGARTTATTRDEAALIFRIEGDELPTLDRVTLFQRQAASDVWRETVLTVDHWAAEPSSSGAEFGGEVRVSIAMGAWAEGEWQFGVSVRDSVGNLSERVAGPVVRLDRTPPSLSQFDLRGLAREGFPLEFPSRLPSDVDRASLAWHREGQPAVRLDLIRSGHGPDARPVRDQDGDIDGAATVPTSADEDGGSRNVRRERWSPVRLPAGQGTLEIAVWDRSGNTTQSRYPLEVEPAHLLFRVQPQRVELRQVVEVKYRCDSFALYRAEGITLEVRGEDGVARYQEPLKTAEGSIVFEPGELGSFQVGLVLPPSRSFLSARLPLTVVAREADGWAREAQENGFLLDCRNYAHRWRNGERSESVTRLRTDLLRRGRAWLDKEPRSPEGWQALATLFVFQAEPDYEVAREHLERALPYSKGAPKAAVFDDLAAIEAQLQRYEQAANYIREALLLEKTAVRYRNLARVHATLLRPDVAAEAYESAIATARLEGSTARVSYYREEWARFLRTTGEAGRLRAERTLLAWERSGEISVNDARQLRQLIE